MDVYCVLFIRTSKFLSFYCEVYFCKRVLLKELVGNSYCMFDIKDDILRKINKY